MSEGWRCPGCGRCYAPHVQQCGACRAAAEGKDSLAKRIRRGQAQIGRGDSDQCPCHRRLGPPPERVGNGDPNHENTKFWQASPSGQIQIGCANLAAAEAFELGREYYVDFTPAS